MGRYRQHDTWPPLRGLARDAQGLAPLGDADDLTVLIGPLEGPVEIEGTATVIDPPEDSAGNPVTDPEEVARLLDESSESAPRIFNWRYTFQEGDLDLSPGSFKVELRVTWDSEATPPAVETFPNDFARNPTFTVTRRLG